MITFPLAGHAASILSQCAEDIVTAFVLDPDADLNLTCLEAMRPEFVLPDAVLPTPPEPLAVSETGQSTGLSVAGTDHGIYGG